MPSTFLMKLPEKIEDWPSLTKAQDLFRRAQEREEWVFRGLPSDNSSPDDLSDLKTTLEEVADQFGVKSDEISDLERKLIFEFMRRYHLYAVEPPPRVGDTLDWLALMRHHGAPSRLLDFTFSFLIAAYFALERKSKGMPAIWAINKSWLTKKVEEIVAKQGKDMVKQFENYAKFRDGNEFRNVFLIGRPCLVSAVSPFRLNQRLTIQQGIFLCPGDVTKTFRVNLEAMPDYQDNVKAICIAPAARPDLLVGLLNANISRATLFPGLDGFASSLWTRVEFLKGLRRMEDAGVRSKLNLDIEALAKW